MNSINNTQSSRSSMGSHDRKLRYRALLEDLSTLEDDNANNVELIDKTATAVKEAKTLLAEGGVEERVKHPGEGYLDSRVLRAASDLAVRYSEAVSGNVHTYDKQMLAQHIRENPDFWEFPFPQEVPPISFLFGTFAAAAPEPRARAPRQHVEREQEAALKAPENVDSFRRKRAKRVTPEQMNAFLSKLEAHPYLNQKGISLSKCEGTWKRIAREMNQLPDGSVKTMKQWITVWRDMKSRTLIKAEKLQNQSLPSEASPNAHLTRIDKRILSIIRGKTYDNVCTKSKPMIGSREKKAVLISQVYGLPETQKAEEKPHITDLNQSENVEQEEDDLHPRLLAIKESESDTTKIFAETFKIQAETARIQAETAKLQAETASMQAQSNILFAKTLNSITDTLNIFSNKYL